MTYHRFLDLSRLFFEILMQGTVFNIQRFSINDGPGIRTTVFLKGCNNRCAWCHNPESLSGHPELLFTPERCSGCGNCIAACPAGAVEAMPDGIRFLRERCLSCGVCVETCWTGARELAGRSMTPEEVMREVIEDLPYYRKSNGGLTVSGGEPMLQRDFLMRLLARSREAGIATALQTAGNYPWDLLQPVLPLVDLVMYDLKVRRESYRAIVGCDGGRVYENLARIAGTASAVAVRTPVVGGVNDRVEEIDAIARFIGQTVASSGRFQYYELIPYHGLGLSKTQRLGKEGAPGFGTPSREKLEDLARTAGRHVENVRCSALDRTTSGSED
jgi:pyruvate formate lyase activating enzyme